MYNHFNRRLLAAEASLVQERPFYPYNITIKSIESKKLINLNTLVSINILTDDPAERFNFRRVVHDFKAKKSVTQDLDIKV
jgi:hypothetical protein